MSSQVAFTVQAMPGPRPVYCTTTPLTIHVLPQEVFLMILGELDRQRWHVICERIVYESPRLSSAAAFLQALYDKPNLGRLVRRLHIRRQVDRAAHTWLPAASGERHVDLALILPNARSLTFLNVGSVFFQSPVCEQLKQLKEVAELEIPATTSAFPALSTLALSHVGEHCWIMPQGGSQCVPSSLKKLRLEGLEGIMEYGEVFRWLDDCRTLRKLELVGIPAKACGGAGSYLTHLAKSGCLLECFTFFPLIRKESDLVHIVYLHGIYRAIRSQKLLNTLHLRAEARHGKFLTWVPALLDNARDSPLTHGSHLGVEDTTGNDLASVRMIMSKHP
ncbi:hypothetical protein C8Q74DRAFT_1437641 [Fomes fomentarius]|nr:hypothetical protein C8Q74DRAFT_1437641 [Fomes fomentarius]